VSGPRARRELPQQRKLLAVDADLLRRLFRHA